MSSGRRSVQGVFPVNESSINVLCSWNTRASFCSISFNHFLFACVTWHHNAIDRSYIQHHENVVLQSARNIPIPSPVS